MKRIVLIFAAVLALLLTGCCRHEWTAASCDTAEICSQCGETNGEALGHDYAPASCEAPETCSRCTATRGEALGHDYAPAACETPETCSRCAATQGEALGHSYGAWSVLKGEEEMSRGCTACGYTETAALDWIAYLTELLQGRWVEESCFTGMNFDSSQYYYYNYAPLAPGGFEPMWLQPNCLEFSPDGGVRILGTGSIEEGTYAIKTREIESGTIYDVEITTDGSEPKYVLSFANYCYRDADGSEQYWQPEGYDRNWYMYDVPPDGSGFRYSIMGDFFPDFKGIHTDFVEADRLGMFVVGEGMFVYAKQDLSAPVAQAFGLPVGTWEAGEAEDGGSYSLSFTETGTFSMTGDIELSGRYRVCSYKWAPLTGGCYEYRLQLDDVSVYYEGKACLCFETNPEGESTPCITINLYRQDGMGATVLQYFIPEGEAPQEAAFTEVWGEMHEELPGKWQLREESPDNDGAARISTDESTLDIGADGSFSLVLQETFSGTWDAVPKECYYDFAYRPAAYYSVSLPADFPYECSQFSLYRNSDGEEEISLTVGTPEGGTYRLHFTKG